MRARILLQYKFTGLWKVSILGSVHVVKDMKRASGEPSVILDSLGLDPVLTECEYGQTVITVFV